MTSVPQEIPTKWSIGQSFVPKGRYVDPDFLQLELDRLFTQVWQPACREEEIPDPGSFLEYPVGRQSIVVVRQPDSTIKAFHNTCAHRGMKIVRDSGNALDGELRCQFHGWRYGLDGVSTFVPCREEFVDRPPQAWGLVPVKVGTWGGWVFVSMAEDPPELLEWLDPLPTALAPFRLEDMRFRWRKRTHVAANWKTVIDAFIEGYHAAATHPQTLRHAQGLRPSTAPASREEHETAPYTPSVPYQNHSRFIYSQRPDNAARDRGRQGKTARPETYARTMQYQHLEVGSIATERDFRAAEQLAQLGPSDTPPYILYQRLSEDLARAEGVDYPSMTMEQYYAGNGDWHVFPTLVMLVEKTCVLGYRVRPDAEDPNRCVFEMFSLEHFPPGAVPRTEWLVVENWRDHDGWGELPTQDLVNLGGIQAGMHSLGFTGLWLNTVQEIGIRNAHAVADRFIFGTEGERRP